MKLTEKLVLGTIIAGGVGITGLGFMNINGNAVIQGLFCTVSGLLLWSQATNRAKIERLEQQVATEMNISRMHGTELEFLQEENVELKSKYNRLADIVTSHQAEIEALIERKDQHDMRIDAVVRECANMQDQIDEVRANV